MHFCSECGNMYDITNVHPDAKTDHETSDSQEETENKKGGKKQIDIPNSKPVYFVCKTCGHSVQIKPQTLILSRKSKDLAKNYFDNHVKPEKIILSKTLPHTRDYICPNMSCISHKQPELRDAVMMRMGNSYNMKYVCILCKTMWKL